MNLATEFGPIDIYLFDQILRGRVPPGSRVFDAGCGGGRNLVYFVRQGYEVFGADADPQAVSAVLQLGVPAENFRTEPLERLSFEDEFDFVIASAVLHFRTRPRTL
jgi:SAM-dependent methyltransferase